MCDTFLLTCKCWPTNNISNGCPNSTQSTNRNDELSSTWCAPGKSWNCCSDMCQRFALGAPEYLQLPWLHNENSPSSAPASPGYDAFREHKEVGACCFYLPKIINHIKRSNLFTMCHAVAANYFFPYLSIYHPLQNMYSLTNEMLRVENAVQGRK